MVTVGSTLLTLTVVEYSVKPPSLSMIRPLTVYVPLLGNVQLVDAVVEIPVLGLPYAYNVANATAMALYEYCRQFSAG